MNDTDIDNILNQMSKEEIQQILDEWDADIYCSSLEAMETPGI